MTTRNLRGGRWCAMILTAGVICVGQGTSIAQETEADPYDALIAVSEAFEEATTLRAEISVSYDAVQDDGQKLEFAEVRTIYIKQPNKLRIDVVPREADAVSVYYNGSKIVMHTPGQNTFAEVDFDGSVAGAMVVLTESLGVPLPMHEFMSPELLDAVLEAIVDASFVDTGTIDGVAYQRFVYRTGATDIQAWIGSDAPRGVRRVVIDYPEDPGQPQFRGSVRSVEVGGELSDDLFEPSVPDDAERLAFDWQTEE